MRESNPRPLNFDDRSWTPACAGVTNYLDAGYKLLRRNSLFFFLGLLACPHFGVEAVLCQQFGMGPLFGYATCIEHDNLVRIDDRR